jgi:hypothetical protein
MNTDVITKHATMIFIGEKEIVIFRFRLKFPNHRPKKSQKRDIAIVTISIPPF